MKKTLLPLVAVALLALLQSCDTKECRCYDFINGSWTGPNASYTSYDNRCADLNTRERLCNEMEDPILDPRDIGVDTKRKK